MDLLWAARRCAAGGVARPSRLVIVLAAVLGGVSGCGYHFVGEHPQLPSDIRSIAVGTIDNKTREHGLEKTLAFAFEREVHIRRHYRLESDKNLADALVNGTIRHIERRPVAFDQSDQAVIYQVTLTVDLDVVRRRDGKRLWRVTSMRKTEEYSSSPRVVVTSSSEFQRGTLDPSNLPRDPEDGIADDKQISSIQLAESERKRAIDRLLGLVVREAYDSIIEGF